MPKTKDTPTRAEIQAAFRRCGHKPEAIAIACDANFGSVYRWIRNGRLPRNRFVRAAFLGCLGLGPVPKSVQAILAAPPAGLA